MARSKFVVACRNCGAQYVKAVDYNGAILFIEHPITARSRHVYYSGPCFACGEWLSPDTTKTLQTLFDREER